MLFSSKNYKHFHEAVLLLSRANESSKLMKTWPIPITSDFPGCCFGARSADVPEVLAGRLAGVPSAAGAGFHGLGADLQAHGPIVEAPCAVFEVHGAIVEAPGAVFKGHGAIVEAPGTGLHTHVLPSNNVVLYGPGCRLHCPGS